MCHRACVIPCIICFSFSSLSMSISFYSLKALEQKNTRVVRLLYDALARSDTTNIVRLLAVDLDPPHCHYMMQVFTGSTAMSHLMLKPQHVSGIEQQEAIAEDEDRAGT